MQTVSFTGGRLPPRLESKERRHDHKKMNPAADATKQIEEALEAGKKSVEQAMKVLTEGYEQALNMSNEQVEKASEAFFKGYTCPR